MVKDVFLYFLRLGFIGFGGPLTNIATMQRDLVEGRKWIEMASFQNAFTLIKAMPGPIAFSMAVFLGRRRAGFLGAVAAAIGFILPSFLLVFFLTMFLARFENNETFNHLMLGMQIGALTVITISLRGLIRGYERDSLFWFLIPISIFLNIQFPSSEPLIILGFGLLLAIPKLRNPKILIVFCLLLGIVAYAQTENVETHSIASLYKLILVCFKSGAFVFGSGLAIVPLLEQEVVQHYHWLTHSQFLNALALGQITPGPVVITATAIGYYVWGALGAGVATVSIFMPSFIHMSTWFPFAVEYLSKQKWIVGFSRGALAAVVGSILLSIFHLALGVEWNAVLITVAVLVAWVSYTQKLPVWSLIPLSGLAVLIKFQFN